MPKNVNTKKLIALRLLANSNEDDNTKRLFVENLFANSSEDENTKRLFVESLLANNNVLDKTLINDDEYNILYALDNSLANGAEDYYHSYYFCGSEDELYSFYDLNTNTITNSELFEARERNYWKTDLDNKIVLNNLTDLAIIIVSDLLPLNVNDNKYFMNENNNFMSSNDLVSFTYKFVNYSVITFPNKVNGTIKFI